MLSKKVGFNLYTHHKQVKIFLDSRVKASLNRNVLTFETLYIQRFIGIIQLTITYCRYIAPILVMLGKSIHNLLLFRVLKS